MKDTRRFIQYIALIVVAIIGITSCSTKKNTASTRFWQSFTGRYNTYYNGTLAYIDGSLEKENGNKDNYTEQIPLYTVSNKSSKELGKGNFDRAIEKSQKVIKLHSITARPEWTKNRKKTEKDIEWLSRKEYNPFLWRAWLLMGRSQFHKGAFDEAAATFSYMSRLYATQPAIYGKARAWLAKCYIEQGWLYDAEDVIRKMERDSIDWRAQKEWDYTYADYYLHAGNLEKASEYLRKVIKHEMRSKQRAREWFLLGQIEAAQGHKQEAYHAFRKVVRQNPPYELEFNARIAMTEVLAQGQAKKMISRLKRMAANDNNAEYLDQVYYAMGNIYLAQRDTTSAISAYEKGNKKATRSGIEKGVLLLHLGDLYWIKEKYSDAQRCYGEAIGLLDKDRPDYKELSERSKVLDELVPHTDAIHLQDSLQVLAKMSEKDRNAAIDRVIEELKRKEKEERDKADEMAAAKLNQARNTGNNRAIANAMVNNAQKNAAWYFYNPTTVQQGKQEFERLWGRRENTDNWQRSNKTVVGDFSSTEDAQADSLAQYLASLTDEQRDSIALEEKKREEEEAKMDSDMYNPHKREYYLVQIPFTDEQVAASNEIIKDALYHSGVIFKDKLDNLALSEKQFQRLMLEFPEFDPKDELYYHLFLLHARRGERATADTYVTRLQQEYPESQWTAILTDPYFEDNARFGKHIEDSLYAATYDAFVADRFQEVKENINISDTRFVLGDNRDKFIFVTGLTLLNEGDGKGCMERMEQVVKDFPQSEVSKMAGMIINGVKAGRKLHGGKFSLTDMWDRRSAIMSEEDSASIKQFSEEVNGPHTFMLVYNPDSVSENKLLFQLARFNFTTFVVRNFELEITADDGLHRMAVSGFRSLDEARQYTKVLYTSDNIKELTHKCRPVVISNENLELLGRQYSYNQYDSFYVEHFEPLDISKEFMLYEPDAVKEEKVIVEPTPALPSENVAPGGATPVTPTEEGDEEGDDDGFSISDDTTIEGGGEFEIMDNGGQDGTNQTGNGEDDTTIVIGNDTKTENNDDGTVIVIDNAQPEKKDDGTVIVTDNTQTQKKDDGTVIVIDNAQPQKKDDGTVIVTPKEENKEDEEVIIIDGEEDDPQDLEDEYFELEGF